MKNLILLTSMALPVLTSNSRGSMGKRRKKKLRRKPVTIRMPGKTFTQDPDERRILRIPIPFKLQTSPHNPLLTDHTQLMGHGMLKPGGVNLVSSYYYFDTELNEELKRQNREWLQMAAMLSQNEIGMLLFNPPHMIRRETDIDLDTLIEIGQNPVPIIAMNGNLYLPPSEIDELVASAYSFDQPWQNPFRVSGLEEHEHRQVFKYLNEGKINLLGLQRMLLDAKK